MRLGIDLGGTKIEIIALDAAGQRRRGVEQGHHGRRCTDGVMGMSSSLAV